MRTILVILVAVQLQGCLFFFAVPTSLFDSANTCIPEGFSVGQSITNYQTGKQGTIKELRGRSERCQDSARPVLAVVEYPA